MRKIIDGKVYDTETATQLLAVGNAGIVSSSDFTYHSTHLYRSRKGQYFLAGHGGALSMWATRLNNGSTGGDGIRLVTEQEARKLVEFHGSAEDYETIFGSPEEG